MKTVELETLQLLLEDMKSGRVRPEHLARFHRNPDAVLASGWIDDMLGLIPPGATVTTIVPRNNLLCVVKDGDGEFVIHGERQGKRRGSVSDLQIRRGIVVYRACSHRLSGPPSQFVVVDEVDGEHYDTIRDICTSPNGIYYVGVQGQDEFVVYHGVERRRFDKVGRLMIWRNMPFCNVEEGDKASMLLDGNKHYCHDAILRYGVSGDRHFRVVMDGGKIYSVADGNKSLPHDDYIGGRIEDGRPLYVMFDGPEQKPTLVHGTEELTALSSGYKDIREPGFGGGRYFFAGKTDEGWYIVHGDKRQGPFPKGPLFPWYNGSEIMFRERAGIDDLGRPEPFRVMCGDQLLGKFRDFRWIGGGGDKLAYMVEENGGWSAFLGGKQGTNDYDNVYDCVLEGGKFLMKVGCNYGAQAIWGRDESRVYDQIFFVKPEGENQEAKTLIYATKGRKVSQLTIE